VEDRLELCKPIGALSFDVHCDRKKGKYVSAKFSRKLSKGSTSVCGMWPKIIISNFYSPKPVCDELDVGTMPLMAIV
jgi:hypothetical protein